MNVQKDATPHTRAANAPRPLDFDPRDFERASRGLIAQHPTGVISTPFGTVYDVAKYSFIEQGSTNPDTVNPSLWRQSQLNAIHGLFEVAPGVWQARGYDISNVTFIAGNTFRLCKACTPCTVREISACRDVHSAGYPSR